MIVYIQSKDLIKPYNYLGYMAQIGFEQRGAEIRYFTPEAMPKIEKGAVLVGGVGTVTKALTQFPEYKNQLEDEDYPETLTSFLGRKIKKISIDEFYALEEKDFPLFVKPEIGKAFTGRICENKEQSLDHRITRGMAFRPFMKLFISEIVNFQTEYRVYVLDKKIQSIARYRGLVDLQPDIQLIRNMIEEYRPQPISYSLDVGVTAGGKSLLVESNCSLSLGNYGLCSSLYAKMIEARWFEITGQTELSLEAAKFSIDSPAYITEN